MDGLKRGEAFRGAAWWVAAVTAVIAALADPGTALAKKFKGSELLIGHSVKPPKRAKLFSAGVDIQVSPFSAVLNSQKEAILGRAVDMACSGLDDPSVCEGNAGLAMEALSGITDDDWDLVDNNLTDTAILQQNLASLGVAPEDQAAVVSYVDQIPVDKRSTAVGLARELSAKDATTLLLEPRVEVNTRHIFVAASFPMAIYMFPSSTDFASGNLALDLRYGLFWDLKKVGMALSFGLDLFLPSAMSDADAMAMANMLYGPKFYHRYLTPAPYMVWGLDATFLTLQLSTDIVPMIPVRDIGGRDPMIYGRYGAGLTFFPKYIFSVMGEINGIYPIHNAKGYAALFASGGFQLRVWRFKGSVAAQFPLISPDKSELGTVGGVDLGTLADFMLLTRLSFTF
ncbi:MAG: hypothetical protein FJ098_09470 [Deltaproteobacteria bacterium]|nr:hypothetical protein [Deltaproteobacteria bacterium]